jgi:hypothetical protein
MGVDLNVSFPGRAVPPWPAVADLLAAHGSPVQMRMIDGELAFPDESPPEPWRELRVAAGGAMITLHRAGHEVRLVTWGNADAAARRLWHLLAWAFAQAGDGHVRTEEGELVPAAFADKVGLFSP